MTKMRSGIDDRLEAEATTSVRAARAQIVERLLTFALYSGIQPAVGPRRAADPAAPSGSRADGDALWRGLPIACAPLFRRTLPFS